MDSRERTFLALNHEEPDRVPTDFWASDGAWALLDAPDASSREAFLDAHDIDLRYIAGPRYVGPPLRRYPDGSDEDIWGVRRQPVSVPTSHGIETYRELLWSPLASATSVDDVEGYGGWPSPDWYDHAAIAGQCRAIRDRGRVAVFMGDRLNRIAQLKPAMYLRGIEAVMEDMALRPELAHAILARVRSFYLAYSERIYEAAGGLLDLVLTGDDFGAQNGPLVSPRMWAAYLGGGFGAFTDLAHSHDVRVMHHTCGAVRPIVPLMIERGLDVLQSLQPEAAGMDAGELKAEHGERLSFHGGISIQHTLPHGTPEEVRREVRDRVERLGRGGGYILGTSHNIQADVPVENVRALLDAYHTCAHYE